MRALPAALFENRAVAAQIAGRIEPEWTVSAEKGPLIASGAALQRCEHAPRRAKALRCISTDSAETRH
jgi:hypothetical protein